MSYNPLAHGARCDICPLKGNVVVPPARVPTPRMVLVGEGPGRNEEKLGAPFVGMSGKLLDVVLAENDFPRSNCHVTNAALCRGETDKENERAAECCAPRLLRELNETLPRGIPIVTMGKTPTKSLLGARKILVARGFIWEGREIETSAIKAAGRDILKAPVEKRKDKELRAETLRGRRLLKGRTVLPTIHPAFVLRADTWKPIFQIDMRRACRVARGEDVAREEFGPYRVGGPELLRGLGPVVSCDIETDGIKPLETRMLCVGLSDGERTVVIWPWKKKHAKPLARFLKSRKQVVFHNGNNFDLLVMQNHGVLW